MNQSFRSNSRTRTQTPSLAFPPNQKDLQTKHNRRLLRFSRFASRFLSGSCNWSSNLSSNNASVHSPSITLGRARKRTMQWQMTRTGPKRLRQARTNTHEDYIQVEVSDAQHRTAKPSITNAVPTRCLHPKRLRTMYLMGTEAKTFVTKPTLCGNSPGRKAEQATALGKAASHHS